MSDPTRHPIVRAVVEEQPDPLVFVTISGAHLYGFPSPDSDFDVRGVHLLPAPAVVGLEVAHETREHTGVREGVEIDLVTHDLRKFMHLLLRRNGYVLEQLCSPLVVKTSPVHARMLELVPAIVTRHHAHHYLGFARSQWDLFRKESPRRVKPLLYVYRVLGTGLHLMQSGEIEANLRTLNAVAKLPQVDDLIARKLAGPEQSTIDDAELARHQPEYERLLAALERARERSRLPEKPTAYADLNALLVEARLAR